MQNLSLQMTQISPLKSSADAANKSDANVDKVASAESNTSFQMMLSKQVQEKQAQEKQANATVQKGKSNASNVQPDTADAGGKEVSTDADSGTSKQLELDPKVLLAKKEDTDAKPADANAIALASALPVPVMNIIPQLNTQGNLAPASVNADTQLTSTLEAATQRQQSLDMVLSNALSQGKSVNVLDQDAQAIQDGQMASEHARWLDVMLPGVAKQAAGDDLASAKLMLNAGKELVNNEAAIPASYQPAAQINPNLSILQAGSSNAINAYPGKSGWDQAISQKVVWMVGASEQSATLTLNPPDLGPLQVVIHVHNDQADTTFISDNAEVRQALQDGMSNLRDKMSESGIQLGQANVSAGGQSQQQFQQATQQRMAASQLNSNAPALQLDQAGASNTLIRVANGLVDTFA